MDENRLTRFTPEERRRNLELASRARHERAVLLQDVREGKTMFYKAIDDPRYRRIPVKKLLVAMPHIGKALATRAMVEAGIADNRRVGGLGCRQRERLLDYLTVHTQAPIEHLKAR